MLKGNKKWWETYILNAVCVCLVLHDGVGGQVEDSPECISDAGRGGLVAGCFVPNGDDVLLDGHMTKQGIKKNHCNIVAPCGWFNDTNV